MIIYGAQPLIALRLLLMNQDNDLINSGKCDFEQKRGLTYAPLHNSPQLLSINAFTWFYSLFENCPASDALMKCLYL